MPQIKRRKHRLVIEATFDHEISIKGAMRSIEGRFSILDPFKITMKNFENVYKGEQKKREAMKGKKDGP